MRLSDVLSKELEIQDPGMVFKHTVLCVCRQ